MFTSEAKTISSVRYLVAVPWINFCLTNVPAFSSLLRRGWGSVLWNWNSWSSLWSWGYLDHIAKHDGIWSTVWSQESWLKLHLCGFILTAASERWKHRNPGIFFIEHRWQEFTFLKTFMLSQTWLWKQSSSWREREWKLEHSSVSGESLINTSLVFIIIVKPLWNRNY